MHNSSFMITDPNVEKNINKIDNNAKTFSYASVVLNCVFKKLTLIINQITEL